MEQRRRRAVLRLPGVVRAASSVQPRRSTGRQLTTFQRFVSTPSALAATESFIEAEPTTNAALPAGCTDAPPVPEYGFGRLLDPSTSADWFTKKHRFPELRNETGHA